VNITNPLPYPKYVEDLNRQKKTVSSVLNSSHSVNALMKNVKNELGISLTRQQAELLFYSMTDYRKYKN